ncbi:MAG TPA: hypothetical protein VLZ04_06660 [Gaiellaceae bacterium]|nr:hypothetical protein [Gaiellaceae bacterium]
MRLEPEPARAAIRALRLGELALQAADLAAEVGGLGDCRLVGHGLRAAVGALRLGERVLPPTLQAQDLGSMDGATAREGQQVGLFGAPAGERVGPLACAPELVDVLAGEDDPAVDDAGHDRVDALSGDRHHGLVEERQPFPHSAIPHEDVALCE